MAFHLRKRGDKDSKDVALDTVDNMGQMAALLDNAYSWGQGTVELA